MLYVLMGATAGRESRADIRDLPQDQVMRVQTLPKWYGVKRTAQFTGVCLFVAYALSLAAYFRVSST